MNCTPGIDWLVDPLLFIGGFGAVLVVGLYLMNRGKR